MKTKCFTIALMLILISTILKAQLGVLFVNDNEVNPGNTQIVLDALDETGFTYDQFDAIAEMRSPDYNEMQPYDLVIWYTGTDGVGRYLWNGDDTDNIDLMLYMSEGGWLWLMGIDFLYDRYTAPVDFNAGEFVYDYLGLATYFGQSYIDDGGVGLPQLDLVEGSALSTLDPVFWTFATLWYADACVPVEMAEPVYQMGPETYVLSDYYSAIFYNAPTHKALSFYFEPALINTNENRIQLFTDVLNFFNGLVDIDENEVTRLKNDINVYPNPVVKGSKLIVEVAEITDPGNELRIFSASGSEATMAKTTTENGFEISTGYLRPGIYLLRYGKLSSVFVVRER